MVRSVNVTTTGDHDNGTPMPVMGDRRGRTTSKSTETTPPTTMNAATQVQTVADLHPSELSKPELVKVEHVEQVISSEIEGVQIEHIEDVKLVEVQHKEKAIVASEIVPLVEDELKAHFVRDAVPDGTVLPPNCVFEQTWVLRNGGNTSWPAGCTVKFVGGDNMCAVDPEHPASVHELVSAAESTTAYSEVAPGQEFGFTVLMRTPVRPGKVISYWRLTAPSGNKFGHRLWCDVTVEAPAPAVKDEVKVEVTEVPAEAEQEKKSQMIFPKLEKESPATSIHQETQETPVSPKVDNAEADDMLEFSEVDDDETEDGFLTDEEYDILDASDEEYLAEQEKAAKK
jgi:next-to-BRCA1 protein 1